MSNCDSNGAALAINAYDEYGIPDFGALAGQRFGYTGQAWLPSVGIWYYKARMYSSEIGGRFMQPDPLGYWDSPNLYAYVGNDPVNFVDPLGLADIIVTGIRPVAIDPNYSFGMTGLFGGMATGLSGSEPGNDRLPECPNTPIDASQAAQCQVTVTGRRPSPPRLRPVLPTPTLAANVSEEDRDRAAEEDYKVCRSLRSAAARARCWQSAAKRDAARASGRPLPPLVVERGAAPVPPAPLPLQNARCLRLRHPVLVVTCMIIS